jgi:hypothetical protein
MGEERFDFENLKVYQKALEYVETPNSPLRTVEVYDGFIHKEFAG